MLHTFNFTFKHNYLHYCIEIADCSSSINDDSGSSKAIAIAAVRITNSNTFVQYVNEAFKLPANVTSVEALKDLVKHCELEINEQSTQCQFNVSVRIAKTATIIPQLNCTLTHVQQDENSVLKLQVADLRSKVLEHEKLLKKLIQYLKNGSFKPINYARLSQGASIISGNYTHGEQSCLRDHSSNADEYSTSKENTPLVFDLGTVREINTIRNHFYHKDKRTYSNVTIQVSLDNENYTTVVNNQGDCKAWQEFNFPLQNVRYIKVRAISDANNYFHSMECGFEAFRQLDDLQL